MTVVLVGNPKPASRTLAAATLVATELTGQAPEVVVDLAELGPGLLSPGDAATASAVEEVLAAHLIVVASPTYKASITGLLKLFLDRLPPDGLAGAVTVAMMLGAGPAHALAPEVFLAPVLRELGAHCPARALYVLESESADPAAYEAWLERARPQVLAALGSGHR